VLNLATLLEDTTLNHPDRIAIRLDEIELPYSYINAAANQVASGLKELGIQKGDKIALSCPNLPYFPIVYYGILKIGAVVVPLNVLLKSREIAYHLQDSGARAYFCFEGTDQLPMAQMGYAGFQEVPDCEHFFVLMSKSDASSNIEGVLSLAAFMYGMPTYFDTEQTSPDDTSVILYTSGTTGRPKGAELSHSNMVMNARLADNLFQRVDHDIHA